MRSVVLGLTTLLLCLTASGQVMRVRLADKKAERKYKKYLHVIGSANYLVGEVKSGVEIRGSSITIRGREFIELFVLDPADPSKVPYRLAGNRKEPTSRRSVLKIMRKHLASSGAISFHMRTQTVLGLASEYRLRLDAIEEIRRAVKEHKTATDAWFKEQRRLVSAYDRLVSWLRGVGFHRAASKIEKTLARQTRLLKTDAVNMRAQAALASVRPIEVDPRITEALESIGAKIELRGYGSQHARLFAASHVEPAVMKQLLVLVERIVEGFRREFIEAYDGEFEDHTPEDEFLGWIFIPDDVGLYERLWAALGGNWGRNKARALQAKGTSQRGVLGIHYLHLWRTDEGSDLEGIVANNTGSDLANVHFNLNGPGTPQDWLREACGYYASFEYLGRNTVTSIQFDEIEYDRDPGDEGVKTVDLGQRAAFNALALKKGASIEDLVLKTLFQLDDANLAKSWSFFDYLARREGKNAVRWLRAACHYGRRRSSMLQGLREESKEIFGVEGDALRELERRWRAFAKSGQKKDDSRRK